ncbi:MAG: HYR domain-containing protein [Bacteroidetes bacterium]|nr:HYR domain-containing protein [Bacteroidota bacterium]
MNDTEAPSITCNANITTTNDNGVCGALVNYTVTSNDNCAGQTISQTSGLASGSIFPIGTTTNAFTVTDASGNTATCSFTVTVNDTEAPTINCPGNIETCDPLVMYTVTATDNCGSPTITYSQASGTMFAIGTTMVTATATDMYGNKDSCTFTVLVKPTSATSSSEDVCDEYIWVENNNTVYNTSGMYSQTFTNMYGCDSVHTLNLIVRHSTSSVENVTAANSYTWLATTLTYTTAGTYTHTLTNAVGCDSLLTLHLSIITINAQRDANISCHGSNDGTGQAVAIGGTGNFVYDIDGGTNFNNTTGYFQNLSAGIHTICAKELPSNVVVCDTFEITEPTAIVIVLTVDSTVSCLGNDGGISASITGGVTINQPYLTTWSSGAPGLYDTYVTGLTPGTYTVSVEDDNYCHATASITVGLTTPLSVSATHTSISCYGGSSVITPSTNGGTGAVTTSISGGTYMVTAGTYTITATDTKGCTATTEVIITQPNLIANSHSADVCDTYTWIENGNTTYTQSGTYTQTYTAQNGCDSVHTLNLIVRHSSSSTTTISQVGCYTWAANNVTYTVSGVHTLSYTNAAGCDSTSTLDVTITPGVYLASKVFLSACYVVADGLMHDSLRLIIPNLEPYSGFPYNKPVLGGSAGETVSNTVLSITGPDAIVDWIFLELRSAANPSVVVETKRALLQRDGDIVSHVDGVSPVFFPASANDDYYVSVKHRNHLGVMTSSALSLRGCNTASIDFTTSSPVYTNGSIVNAPRKLMGSVQTLWSSDANNNKNAKYNGLSNDKDKVLASIGGPGLINSTVYGYRAEDVNMDGKVRFNGLDNDRNVILLTVGVSTPNNIMNQHTPN